MITYQREKLSEITDEITKMFVMHWNEIGIFDKEKISFAPDWNMYFNLEDANMYFLFTARKNGKLIGYYGSFILYHPHYRDTKTGQNDIIYLEPSYRKGKIGLNLIKNAENELKKLDIKLITLSIKTKSDLHKMAAFLKYKPLDSIYYKEV